MAEILYATFADKEQAVRAAGALLDFGVKKTDVSIVVEPDGYNNALAASEDADRSANIGITTTTPEDAEVGAAKGAGVGLGVGVLAGLASLFVPGVGIVVGGGALATAIGAAVGTTAAGAVAGGVTGYLKDQGIDEPVAVEYTDNLKHGGALLELILPSGNVTDRTGRDIVTKYGGSAVYTH